MKRMSSILLACLVCIVGLGVSSEVVARTLTIRSGTIVVVNTLQAYSSETAKPDEIVNLVVASDVIVDGQVVIKAGAPASGAIEELQATEMLGREGRIAITINGTRAVDGTQVPLSGRISSRGQDEMTGTVVGAIFCPLFLLNKGGEAAIANGAQGRGIVLADVLVTVP